mgnify:CR=1 FL=1
MKKHASTFMLVALLFMAVSVFAQTRAVNGTVTDENGDPVIAATVSVTGTDIRSLTDLEGNFSIEAPLSAESLTITYVGMDQTVVSITDEPLSVKLFQDDQLLEGVVVTALGVTRDKKSLGYSIQEVSGETLDQTKETNVVNALQGQVAGVQIQGTQSSLGGSSRITIRGANSFTRDNQPLFVVDGVPIANTEISSNAQQRGFGGETAYDYGNFVQDLDPSSIETMSVLKGTAATALYGQRGANGVILITTKDGSKTKGIGVTVNSSFTADNAVNLLPHQQEYGGGAVVGTNSGFNEIMQNGTRYLYPVYSKDGAWGPKYDQSLMVRHWDSWDPDSPNYLETRPWVAPANDYEEFFGTGLTATNSVSLEGSNGAGNFRLGYTNLDQTDVMPNGGLQRNSITFNSGYNLTEKLKANLSGNYIRTDASGRTITGYNNGNPMQAFTQWWQTQLDVERLEQNQTTSNGSQYTWNALGPVADAEGNFNGYNFAPNFFDNPHWARNNYFQEDFRNRFFGNASLAYQITDELGIRGQLSTDFYDFSAAEGIPLASVATSFFGAQQRGLQENNYELRLNYANDFSNLFSLTAFAGGNRMRQDGETFTQDSNGGLSLEGFYNIANSAASPIIGSSLFEYGINSLFGGASFGFNDWLYLDVTGRNDWSSTLPDQENSYFYPSASMSAVLSELDFLANSETVSFAKIRAAYGEAANDAPAYSLTDVFSPVTPNFGGFPRYSVPNTQNNPELKPERTSEFEIGLAASLFVDRLNFDIAYYDRTTEDLIFNVPSSSSTGYTSRALNAGEMRNWGMELQLSGTPIKTQDFRWDLGLNLFQQNNEVVELADGVESINFGNTWAADLRVNQGDPYMALYGADYIRENYETDADGNVTRNDGELVVGDNGFYQFTPTRQFLGSAIADWVGGFNTNFKFKNLSLSGLFDFQEGGVIHSTSLQWSKYSGMDPSTVAFNGESDTRANGMVLPGVKADGSANDIRIDPQSYYQGVWFQAAPNVYDASYLKFREARLNYNIPNNVFGKAPFRNASIGVFGRNLAILSADLPYLDPQVITGAGNAQGLENAQVPSRRSIGVNLKFGF